MQSDFAETPLKRSSFRLADYKSNIEMLYCSANLPNGLRNLRKLTEGWTMKLKFKTQDFRTFAAATADLFRGYEKRGDTFTIRPRARKNKNANTT